MTTCLIMKSGTDNTNTVSVRVMSKENDSLIMKSGIDHTNTVSVRVMRKENDSPRVIVAGTYVLRAGNYPRLIILYLCHILMR